MFVFLIDSNPMITDWLQRQAKARGDQFYALATLAEAAYFIHDMKPDVLVLDGKTVQRDHEKFLAALNEYSEIKQLPTLGLGESLPEWTGALNLKGHIKKPLDPSRFHEQVEKLLKGQE
jgi:DNA-binding response OmpR family regulator